MPDMTATSSVFKILKRQTLRFAHRRQPSGYAQGSPANGYIVGLKGKSTTEPAGAKMCSRRSREAFHVV